MYLITCGENTKIHDFSTFEVLYDYQADPSCMIQDTSFNTKGLFIGNLPIVGQIEILQLQSKGLVFSHYVKKESPTAISFMKENSNSLGVSNLEGISIWDCTTKSFTKDFEIKNVNTLDFNCNDSILAADNHKEIFLLNLETESTSTLNSSLYNNISLIKFHHKQSHILLCCTFEGSLLLFNCNQLKTDNVILNDQPYTIEDCTFSRFNQKLVSTVGKNKITIYDIKNSKPACWVKSNHHLTSVDLSFDGNYLAVGTTTGFVSLYDMRSFSKPIKSWKAHETKINRLRFKPIIPVTTCNKSLIEEKKVSQIVSNSSPSKSKVGETTFEIEDSFLEMMKKMKNSPIPCKDISKQFEIKSNTTLEDSFIPLVNAIFPENKFSISHEKSLNVSSCPSEVNEVTKNIPTIKTEEDSSSSTLTSNPEVTKNNYISPVGNTLNPLKIKQLTANTNSLMTPVLNTAIGGGGGGDNKEGLYQESPAMFNCLAHSTPNAPIKDNTELIQMMESQLVAKFQGLDTKLEQINIKLQDMENKMIQGHTDMREYARQLYINYVISSSREYQEYREYFHLLLSNSNPSNQLIVEVMRLRQENALLKSALKQKESI